MPDITGDDIDAIADKLDDVENVIDQGADEDSDEGADQDAELFCLGCGYLGAEEECPECGEKMAHIPSEGGYATYPGDDIDEAVSRFASSARAICEQKNYSSNDIASALNHSWSQHTTNIDSRVPTKAIDFLRRLKRTYPGFNPTLTESRSNAMSSDNTFFGAKGMKPSPHLHDQPSDMNEIAGRDPRKRSQKNPIGTPTVGKGSMEHAGTVKSGGPKNEGRLKSLNANILKENAEKLAKRIKYSLREAAHSIRGKHLVNFTVMVTEGNEKNRTMTRRRLAEAIADAEEVLQFHSVDDVMLEAWFKNANGTIVMKKDIPLGLVAPRGPIVSEGKAIFRFRRNAEIFSESLGNVGYVCRVMPHNWGAAVSAPVTMETANRAFRSISEGWDPRTWSIFGGGKKKAPQSSQDALAAEYAGMQMGDDEYPGVQQGDATRPGGYSNRRAPASNTATQPPFAGKMRQSLDQALPGLAQRVQTSMQTVRQLIRQLQESMRRRRNLVEWSKDDDLGSALDNLSASYNHTHGDSAQSMGLSKGIAHNIMNQLAKVLMPDELGYNQQHERALTAILQKAIQQVEDTKNKLMQYVSASNKQTANAKNPRSRFGQPHSGGGAINRSINARKADNSPSDLNMQYYGDRNRRVNGTQGGSIYTPRASAEGRFTNRRPINESVQAVQSLFQKYQAAVEGLENYIKTVQKGTAVRTDKRRDRDEAQFVGNRGIARQNAPNTRTRNTTGTFGSQQSITPKAAAPLRAGDADDDIVFNRPSGGPKPPRRF